MRQVRQACQVCHVRQVRAVRQVRQVRAVRQVRQGHQATPGLARYLVSWAGTGEAFRLSGLAKWCHVLPRDTSRRHECCTALCVATVMA